MDEREDACCWPSDPRGDSGAARGRGGTGTLHPSLLGSVLNPPSAAGKAEALPSRPDNDKYSSGVAKWTTRHGFPSSHGPTICAGNMFPN